MEWVAATQAQLAELDFDLDRFMQSVVERVPQVTEATGVIVELVDGEHMVYRATSPGLAPHLGLRLQRAGSLSGLCVEQAQTLYCRDSETDPRVDKLACRRVGLRSMVCVPLITHDTPVGVLKALSDAPDGFGSADMELLGLLAKALATALGKQVAFEAMQRETEARRRLEISLRASETRANRVIGEARHAIVGMDEAGRITAWNPAATGVFGWTEAEAIGADLADLIIAPAKREAVVNARLRFLATGEHALMNRQTEVPALRKDGAVIAIELAVSSTQDADGWRFTGLIQDITERKAQTELFETAFDHAPIGFALVGLDGGFLKINDAFAAIVGYAPDELLACDFQRITHPDDLDRDLGLLADLTGGRISKYQMDKRYLRKDGRQVWVNLSVSMVCNPDGSPKHYIAQVQDLTARMEVEARYRLMAENSTDMIVTTEDGITTFVSGACLKVVGRTTEQCLGLSPAEYVDPRDLPGLHDAFRRTAAGETGVRARWRGWHQVRDCQLWLESSPSLLDTGGGHQIFVDVVRDVTDQVAHEQALAQARAEAEAAAAAKAEFLANMSHEIRTPLTAVIGFSGLLQAQADLAGETRLYADRIATAGQALLALVNDILDFSKLEAGEVEIKPRPMDPAAMGQEILGLFQAQAQAKGLALDFRIDGPAPGVVMLDPQALRQVLLNLIGNAVKFTERGAVSLTLAHAAGRLAVTIADTGPGMDAAQMAKLFQRFSQVDGSSTRKHGGTGLGLAICKALVEAQGGRIGVTSAPGEGAAFRFEVDAPPAAAELVSLDLAAAEGSIEGVRVLVTDDNPVNRELARAILEGLGAEVTEAGDGLGAVEAAQTQPFDILLMDLRMPRLDGPGAMARIRGEPGPNQDVPILAFSAGAAVGAGEVPAGFDGAVAKPVTVGALAGAIAAALNDQMQAPPGGLSVHLG
jgi:PAS domain S-box-containing protein